MKTPTPSRACPKRAPQSKIIGKKQETSSSVLQQATHAPFKPFTLAEIARMMPGLVKEAQEANMKMSQEVMDAFMEAARIHQQAMRDFYVWMGRELAAHFAASEMFTQAGRDLTRSALVATAIVRGRAMTTRKKH